MYLMTQCQHCEQEKYKCKCSNMTMNGMFYEENTKRFYTWEDLRKYYESRQKAQTE